MDQSITLNAKAFTVTNRPSPTSCVFTTRSRGQTLPDTLMLAHRQQKNPVEPGSTDKLSTASVKRTYINADGVVKTVGWSLNSVRPDDCPDADSAAALADLTDFIASAITLRSANIAALENGEVA